MFAAAARLSVADLFSQRAQAQPDAPALGDGEREYSYRELHARVERLARALAAAGVVRGERIALLSENRIEYLEIELAAARLGAIVACQNWRLAGDELRHCIRLVAPVLLVVSPRFAAAVEAIDHGVARTVELGEAFERLREAVPAEPPAGTSEPEVDPEAGLVILYTSGTTGLPKGALISQRAMVARSHLYAADCGARAGDAFIAWSPLFHMAGTDHSLATLMMGGRVAVVDGLDVERICAELSARPVGWLVAMPGMIEALTDALRRLRPAIRPLRVVGAMADLVPPHQIAELTALLGAPYLNSFGSTETGLAPASGALILPGVAPTSLAKRISGSCRIRLVDADGRDVADGEPGELAMRGPTLFSGYWNATDTNARDFRNGWFHMGDVFVRHADGTISFVDRVKYLIKSGGENIYPAEIERALLAHPRVRDAAVVRRRDERWGEVPVAFVALAEADAPAGPDPASGDAHVRPGSARAGGDARPGDAGELMAWCRERLASYKLPREIRFIGFDDFPRSSTGKIQRHELERRI